MDENVLTMEKELKILMLEDVRFDVDLAERVLKKDGMAFVTKQVDTREEFIDGVETFRPDIVLSDHALPQFNSIEAYKICKERGLTIPFILVTGTVSEEFAVTCLKQGIDDYVLKSNLSRLPLAIKSSLKQKELEREKEISLIALKEQNEAILKINQELDSFSYSISHNLRAPLASIKGLLDLTKYEDSETQGKFYSIHSKIEESINKLDVTLKQMLDHSRNARLDISPEKIDLRKFIEETWEGLTYLEGISSIQWKVSVSEEAPFCSDKYRLGVILKSILSNSIKYRDVTKQMQLLSIDVMVNQGAVCIQFQDNGIGISKEVFPRIFEMFYRGNERSDGAGLGLYIVSEVVDKLGGKVNIFSEEGEGATVIVLLPNLYQYKWLELLGSTIS